MNFRHSIMAWLLRDPLSHHVLHADLVSARFGVTLEQYLWKCLRIAILAGIFFGILGYLVGRFFAIQIAAGKGIYNVLNLRVPDNLLFLFGPLALEIAGAWSRLLSGLRCLGPPHALARDREEEPVRPDQPDTPQRGCVHVRDAQGRGAADLDLYRSSEHAQTYGEVALEFRQVVRDVDYFGADVVSAIRHLGETTPSEKLKDFLEDLLSVIESGGDMTEFLSSRVRLYQEQARFEQKQFLTILSMVAESYVTLFVAGPLFLIIVMVVMGMMGGSAVIQLSVVIYAIIPIGSLVFILLVDLIRQRPRRPSGIPG